MEIEQLRAAIDDLAEGEIVGVTQRDELAGLWQQKARFDAQLSRRIGEFDTSVEWSVDGSRSAASWLLRDLRLATGEAHARVRVARQIAQMPIARERGRKVGSVASTSTCLRASATRPTRM